MRASLHLAALVLALSCGGSPPDDGSSPDSWVAMSTEGAPRARKFHGVGWTGTEMIVWGGGGEFEGDPNHIFADGGRYRPAEDRWIAMSSAGAPSTRQAFSSTWAGTRFFVWGGSPPADGEGDGVVVPLLDDGALYDPTSDTWSPISQGSAPSARGRATAVWTGNEVIVWGGGMRNVAGERVILTDGAAYDIERGEWSAISAEGAPALFLPLAAWTGDEMLVFDYLSGAPLLGGALYDPGSDAWRPMSRDGLPSDACGAVWAGTKLIVFQRTQEYSTYDPATDTWAVTSTESDLCTVVPVWTGERILSWNPKGRPAFNLDPDTSLVSPINERGQPSVRADHSAIWTGAEMIIWGGEDDTYLNTGARYRP